MTYKVGQSVVRNGLTGVIVRAYSIHGHRFGPYPELYDVLWSGEQEPRKGYLPHGIRPA